MKKFPNKLLLLLAFGSGMLLVTLSLTRVSGVLLEQKNNPSNISTAQIQTETKLAQELQGKPVFVQIYSDSCPTCKAFKPTMVSLKQQYSNSANFIVLDISTKSTTQAAATKAEQLGLSNFFNAHRSLGGTVAIFNPSTGEVLTQYRRNLNKADYVNALDSAITQTRIIQ